MAVHRAGTLYEDELTGSVTGIQTLTTFDPDYPTSDVRGRIIWAAIAICNIGNGAVGLVPRIVKFGDLVMRRATIDSLGAQATVGLYYVINPPSGPQDIYVEPINTVAAWRYGLGLSAYYSDLDTSFRVTANTHKMVTNVSSLSTDLQNPSRNAMSVAASVVGAAGGGSFGTDQTLTGGVHILDAGAAVQFSDALSDPGNELAYEDEVTIACTTPSNRVIWQQAAMFVPFRGAFTDFLAGGWG